MTRPDEQPLAGGPLAAEELKQLLHGPWEQSGPPFLARCWQIERDLAGLIRTFTEGPLPLSLSTLHDDERIVLTQLVRRRGRLRGETLRRELLLQGFGDLTATFRDLVARGLLLPLPAPAEHTVDLETLASAEELLQRELVLPLSLFLALEALDEKTPVQPSAWDSVTADPITGTVEDLELNLLHLASLIRQDPLKINKDGTPNRRNLQRSARGISLPGTTGEIAGDLDLHDAEQLDYLTFLVALARELQLLTEVDGTYRSDEAALRAFFRCAGPERDRRLIDGAQRLRFWNELDSLRVSQSTARAVDGGHFSQHQNTGQPLIGARGFVVSILRRAHLSDWISRDALVELCTLIDRQYLSRTLSQLPGAPEPESFIDAVLSRTLVWTGMLQTGVSDTGVSLLRITNRGKRALGLHSAPDPDVQGGCLIVQPNLEIMVFLDNAPVAVLHELYRVGERRKLSDRVATFQLATESVQRGYALGADAEGIIALLSKMGHTPLPEAVSFQLRDWERVHRQVSVYLGGISLRHPDPERFDLICGQLEHDLRDSDAELIRLGAREAFVSDAHHEDVVRTLANHPSISLDALGAPPQCLHFVDPLVVLVDPYHLDVVTRVELEKIALFLEEDSSARAAFYELRPDLIRQRFPEDPLAEIQAFLDPRCPDGLPAPQLFRLRADLAEPARFHVVQDTIVITLESQHDADIFADLPDSPDLIVRRLGPQTFALHPGVLPLLEELVEELGLRATANPPESEEA